MKCILFGGSGQVGGAVARALVASEACSQLTLLGRRPMPAFDNVDKVRVVVVDTAAEDVETVVADHARGHDAAICCIGVGSGTAFISEAQMAAVEVTLSSRFARGCKAAGIEDFALLTAWGVTEHSERLPLKYLRVVGRKLNAVRAVDFARLAVFKPGMIVGNAHSPRWLTPLTALIPDAIGLGNIRQEDIANAFVIHLRDRAGRQSEPVVSYGNREMKALIRDAG